MKITYLLLLLFFSNLVQSAQVGSAFCPNKENINSYHENIERLTSRELDIDVNYYIDNKAFIKRPLYQRLENLFNSCFSDYLAKVKLKQLSSTQLHKLFLIVSRVNFYIPKPFFTEKLTEILTLKQSKGENINHQLHNVYQSYIKLRQFAYAKEFADQYPEINFSRIPENIKLLDKASTKTTYQLQLINGTPHMIQTELEPEYQYQVVIISSPICHPSNRFLNWLHQPKNIRLKNALLANSLFIVPPAGTLFLDEWQSVNKQYPKANMQLVNSKSDWPEIQYWSTPTMYFYKDGELVHQLIGWPQEGREQELITAMTEVGLLN